MIKFSKSDRINKALYDMGLMSYKDIIFHLPRRYEDMSITHENNLTDKERVVFYGEVVGSITSRRFKNLSVTQFSFVTVKKNVFYVEAWNRPYLSKILTGGGFFTLIGSYDAKKNKINLINILKDRKDGDRGLKPIYSLTRNIDNYEFIQQVDKAFKAIEPTSLWNEVPDYFAKKYRLASKYEALYLAHKPANFNDIYKGLRVLKYEECLMFSLKTQIIRNNNKELNEVIKSNVDEAKINNFINALPYKLTGDQSKCFNEILDDMEKGNLMYRLLQGDVGSGKTLVAILALYANYTRGDQGAFMAPTDSLARQHYRNLVALLSPFGVRVALLLGSSSSKDRAAIRNALINNEVDIVVGTHILFSKDINYLSLGLAIIDEQHKFGVNQRMYLANKGSRADLLLMSATPIPRTLALTLYGDLDVSTITEFPFDNKNVVTEIIKDEDRLFEEVKKSIENNKRVYIVAPMIIETEKDQISVEKLFARYLLKFPGKVALLHGKMDDDDKHFAIRDFIKGTCPILISTTVIEVGIDVKEANLMIIYDPSHFGLASLHQLRGRIGRDGSDAKCLLMYEGNDEEELDKLNVLVNSNDGFHIAEEDLRRRGPGELIGVKQSGIAKFNYVNLVNDFKMFEAAREDAKFILNNKDYPGFKRIITKASKEIDDDNFTNV